jgi:hypothetical protein
MLIALLQLAALVSLAILLGRWRTSVRRRNAATWDSLVARLRVDWSARDLSDSFLWKEGTDATPQEIWTRIQGAHGLWAMYQNAGVMLEMVDFATRSGACNDLELMATLRSDALQIRVCVLMALAQYAFTHASEGVRINAFRAANLYTGMAARMTRLLQESAAVVLPDFVAAM